MMGVQSDAWNESSTVWTDVTCLERNCIFVRSHLPSPLFRMQLIEALMPWIPFSNQSAPAYGIKETVVVHTIELQSVWVVDSLRKLQGKFSVLIKSLSIDSLIEWSFASRESRSASFSLEPKLLIDFTVRLFVSARPLLILISVSWVRFARSMQRAMSIQMANSHNVHATPAFKATAPTVRTLMTACLTRVTIMARASI